MEEEVDAEEILPEDQMEQKDNNPWAEGIKAGPRDSDDFFKKYLYRAAFEICFRYRATSILKPISFVSLSDQDLYDRNSFQ